MAGRRLLNFIGNKLFRSRSVLYTTGGGSVKLKTWRRNWLISVFSVKLPPAPQAQSFGSLRNSSIESAEETQEAGVLVKCIEAWIDADECEANCMFTFSLG